jgi:hypothetical protein
MTSTNAPAATIAEALCLCFCGFGHCGRSAGAECVTTENRRILREREARRRHRLARKAVAA